MSDRGTETGPSDGLFFLQRLTEKKGKHYLIWHEYMTAEARERWAAKYRERGDKVTFVGDGTGGIYV